MFDQTEIKHRLQEIDPTAFERLVAMVWSEMGWETTVTPQSDDRGIDVVADKQGMLKQRVVIQAKRYSTGNKVGRPEIQQYNSLPEQVSGADAAVVITTSTFTDGARELARELGVKTVDGEDFARACVEYLHPDQLAAFVTPDGESDTNAEGDALDDTAVSTIELDASERDLAKFFRTHFMRLQATSERRAADRTMFFRISSDIDERGSYSVTGSVHKIKFSAESAELCYQLKKTADNYGWDILNLESYAEQDSGLELHAPMEEADTFLLIADTMDGNQTTPERQAKISSLVLERVYDTELSGIEVTESGPRNDSYDFLERVIT